MKTAITYTFTFAHPIDRVWALLTDPVAMAKWLMPNDFVPTLGHRFTFTRKPMPSEDYDGVTHCEVIALDPPHTLAFTFVGGPLDTIVRFRLEATATGTTMHFAHEGFDDAEPRHVFPLRAMGPGWAKIADSFEKLLAQR